MTAFVSSCSRLLNTKNAGTLDEPDFFDHQRAATDQRFRLRVVAADGSVDARLHDDVVIPEPAGDSAMAVPAQSVCLIALTRYPYS